MQSQVNRKQVRRRIRHRIRNKISGTASRPRVAVFRSLKNIYAQAIDDGSGKTLARASSADTELKGKVTFGGNVAAATQVGALMAARLKDAGIGGVVFDRGGFVYHGRVKALADALRKGGVKL